MLIHTNNRCILSSIWSGSCILFLSKVQSGIEFKIYNYFENENKPEHNVQRDNHHLESIGTTGVILKSVHCPIKIYETSANSTTGIIVFHHTAYL